MAFDPDVDDVIGVVADAVGQQRCILFLGAGVHAPPPDQSRFEYPAEQRPPIGAALSQKLAAGCNLAERLPSEDRSNLQRVALFYETRSEGSTAARLGEPTDIFRGAHVEDAFRRTCCHL